MQNWLQRLKSWATDASLDTHIYVLDQLWQLWPYRHNGRIKDIAIVAIDAIVDPGRRYGCLKKRLDLRISASEAILPKEAISGVKTKNAYGYIFPL